MFVAELVSVVPTDHFASVVVFVSGASGVCVVFDGDCVIAVLDCIVHGYLSCVSVSEGTNPSDRYLCH